MSRYRNSDWMRLRERRLARKSKLELLGDHPLSHIDKWRRYQWMREDCAQYESAREAREDNLIAVVIQISSAALIAIPGFIFNVYKKFPALSEEPLIFIGLFGFFISLICAMAEQMLSAHAYGRQSKVATAYYQMRSHQTFDSKFTRWTKVCRYVAYASFVLSLAVSAIAIAYFEEPVDVGKKAISAAATTATATPSATPSSTPSVR